MKTSRPEGVVPRNSFLRAVDAVGDEGEAALDVGAAVDAVLAPLIDVLEEGRCRLPMALRFHR